MSRSRASKCLGRPSFCKSQPARPTATLSFVDRFYAHIRMQNTRDWAGQHCTFCTSRSSPVTGKVEPCNLATRAIVSPATFFYHPMKPDLASNLCTHMTVVGCARCADHCSNYARCATTAATLVSPRRDLRFRQHSSSTMTDGQGGSPINTAYARYNMTPHTST